MKLAYDYYKSFIFIDKDLNKERFLEEVGVKNGFSYEMFSRIYDSITSGLVNAEIEYQKYYSFEYDSFEKYLYRKLNMKVSEIEDLLSQQKENPNCILYRKNDNAYGDYGLSQFIFSDTMYDRIISILIMKNAKNEN